MLLTGTEHAHRNVRLVHNYALDCSDHNSMENYIVAYQMRNCGWQGTIEFSRVSRSWNENCPTLVHRFLNPSRGKKALYIYHTGDHYKVVMSVSGST